MKRHIAWAVASFVAVLSALGQTNNWTKSNGGNWEESYWSLGRLPGIDQQLVSFNNYGWKALVIGATTTASYPQSLSLNNLLIDGPTNSLNTLLLNWAHLSVLLVVHSNLTIGTNGSLVSHYSAMQAANVYIDGSASFMDYATEDFGNLWLRSGATLGLTNGVMTCSNVTLDRATFIQNGGTHVAQNINLPELLDLAGWRSAAYYLQGGILTSQNLNLGSGNPNSPTENGLFQQTGGVHTNVSMVLAGWKNQWGSFDSAGQYELDQGLLVSSSVHINGQFVQTGGTNLIQDLEFGDAGSFLLYGGQLITSNAFVFRESYEANQGFHQSEGVHTVRGRLLIQDLSYRYYPTDRITYDLAGGNLVAANIEIQGGVLHVSSQGTLSNTEMLTLSDGGTLIGSAETPCLGQLQVSGGNLYLHDGSQVATNACVWSFADSRALPWSGRLKIFQWGLIPGDRIFFGTDSNGLTAAQLAQIEFVGTNADYPATLLATGELVPITNVNNWTKPTSGSWEESYWSLGRLPGMDQAFVAINNPGAKTVTIGPNTAANHPQSLAINNLAVEGATNELNILLLNGAGLSVPLDVNLTLTIGAGGSLESHASALHAEKVCVDGSITFSENSKADFGELWLRSDGTLGLTNGMMTCSNLTFSYGTFTQTGGTNVVHGIGMSSAYPFYYSGGYGVYYLQGGTLISEGLSLGVPGGHVVPDCVGVFVQTGGVHTNSGMDMEGYQSPAGASYAGGYILRDGLLVSGSLTDAGGYYSQTGGTNIVQELKTSRGAYFGMHGGELIVSNATIEMDTYVGGWCEQTGGKQTVLGQLLVDGPIYSSSDVTKYSLSGGSLTASKLDIASGGIRISSNACLTTANLANNGVLIVSDEATVSNAGIISISGTINSSYYSNIEIDAAKSQYLGQLQVLTGCTLSYYGGINGAAVRFADSHQIPWSGSLQIQRWRSDNRIFFGTNAAGLTAAQLAQVTFQSPIGLSGNVAAILRPTGEIIPAGLNFADGYAYVTTNNTVTIVGYVDPSGNLVIPSSLAGLPVRTISDYAFSSANLSSLVIPDGVTVIGRDAFYGCTNLTNITIGNSVGLIGDGAFDNCSALTSMTIPNSVTNLGSYNFYGCYNLTNVSIGDGVTVIHYWEFQDLTNLANVSIGTGVGLIGPYAFENCTALTSLTIPNNVTNIDYWAFHGCSSLSNVVIGSGLLTLGDQVFVRCAGLTAFWVNESNNAYSSMDGVLFNKDRSTLIQYPLAKAQNYVIPDTVKTIEYAAFAGSKITGLSGGSKLSTIGGYAFNDSSNLTTLSLPPSLTEIGAGVFAGCRSLPFVSIPDSITNVPDMAFQYCSSLTNAVFGNGVTRIGSHAFDGCSGLTSMAVPNSITYLGTYAFYNCTGLAEVTIGNRVTVIGYATFYNCSGLTSLTIPNNVTNIGYAAFGDCTGLTNVSIGNGVGVIGEFAFYNCSALTSIAIPDRVTVISYAAFADCSGLTNVSIGNGVGSIGEFAFYNCSALTSIAIPNNVTIIDYAAFYGCSNLATVSIGSGMIAIGQDAFGDCTSLKAVYFLGNAPYVNYYAFYLSQPTVYYLPGTTGWETTLGGRPTEPWYLPTPTVLNFGLNFGVQTNCFGFVISWATNSDVVVEVSTNLGSPAWSSISTNILVNGSCCFTDAAWTNYPIRLYRVRAR